MTPDMKTVLTSLVSAATAAVIAAFVVLAIDDDPVPPSAAPALASVEEQADTSSSQPVANSSQETAIEPVEPEGLVSPTATDGGDPADLLADFDPVAIFDAVGPSVVNVSTNVGGGTGFFIDDLGHIVTNYHVIQGVDQVLIIDAAGNAAQGEVLGFDRANDLAIIKVDPADLDVRPVALADSDLADVGQPVAAIGSPFGLSQTLTTGVISAIERTRDGLQPNGRPQRGLLQTDAAINPGNSGGVLVDARGEVIGITNSVESPIRGSVGVGFAIPSNVLARFLDQMIAGEDVSHPWIGISPEFGSNAGELTIGRVIQDTPAELAGIQIGDRLLRIDGTTLVEFSQLANLLDSYDVGDQVTFEIERNGNTITVDVELGAWPG